MEKEACVHLWFSLSDNESVCGLTDIVGPDCDGCPHYEVEDPPQDLDDPRYPIFPSD